MIDLTDWQQDVVDRSNSQDSRLVVAYFTAPWCGPCRMLKPTLSKLEEDNQGLDVVRIDVDTNTELARQFQIMSVPTLVLYQSGIQVGGTIVGIKPRNTLQELFAPYL